VFRYFGFRYLLEPDFPYHDLLAYECLGDKHVFCVTCLCTLEGKIALGNLHLFYTLFQFVNLSSNYQK